MSNGRLNYQMSAIFYCSPLSDTVPNAEAAFGDVILLALPYWKTDEALSTLVSFELKILITAYGNERTTKHHRSH